MSVGHEVVKNDYAVLEDSHVREDTPDTKYPDTNPVYIGERDVDGQKICRPLIRFAAPSGITMADIEKAELKIFVSATPMAGTEKLTIKVKRATEDWNEDDVCWNDKPGMDATVWGESAQIDAGFQDVVTIDITALVKVWSGLGNYGIYLDYSLANVSGHCYAYVTTKEGTPDPIIEITHWGDKDKVWKAKATSWMGIESIAGFAVAAVSAEETVKAQGTGGMSGFTITAGKKYYVSDTPGEITNDPFQDSTVAKAIGSAVSSSLLGINLKLEEVFSAGDILLDSADSERYADTSETSYTKVKEIRIGKSGTLRIKFDLKINAQYNGNTGYGRIYVNGSGVGTERIITSTNWATYSQDIRGLSTGDLVQVYLHTDSVIQTLTRYFRLYAAVDYFSLLTYDQSVSG